MPAFIILQFLFLVSDSCLIPTSTLLRWDSLLALFFKMLLKFLISLVFHEAYIYLFHFKIIFSEMCPLLLSRFYQSCLINTIFDLHWPCFFWASFGFHQAFHGYVTLLTHSHPVIYRFIQILVTLSLCWVPRHYQKFLLAPNSTTL